MDSPLVGPALTAGTVDCCSVTQVGCVFLAAATACDARSAAVLLSAERTGAGSEEDHSQAVAAVNLDALKVSCEFWDGNSRELVGSTAEYGQTAATGLVLKDSHEPEEPWYQYMQVWPWLPTRGMAVGRVTLPPLQ